MDYRTGMNVGPNDEAVILINTHSSEEDGIGLLIEENVPNEFSENGERQAIGIDLTLAQAKRLKEKLVAAIQAKETTVASETESEE